jgi:hypothetical protein
MKLIKRFWNWLHAETKGNTKAKSSEGRSARRPNAQPVDRTADELHLVTIGALLINELYKSRELRKKIRGTNLEKQLKQLLK